MAIHDIIMAAAGSASTGTATYVEDVFSTSLYTGNGSTQTITNGIDLATKGGLVWVKARAIPWEHELYDTIRGSTFVLRTSTSQMQQSQSNGVQSFTASGFTLGSWDYVNYNTASYVSWTFRKQPKFFDIVTWTGNGANNRLISHSLDCIPGMIIIKRTDESASWVVYHTSLGYTNYIALNNANGASTVDYFGSAPTSTQFRLGTAYFETNFNGGNYIAYLFADSNSGGFGASGTDSVVACGSYTGNGSASGPTVALGWEPQFVLVKMSSSTGNWQIFDNMRGIPTGSADPYLFANTSGAEATTNGDLIDLTPTGFVIKSTNALVNTSSGTYIYLAIRKNMKV